MLSLVIVLFYVLITCSGVRTQGFSEHVERNIGGPQEYCLAEENFSPKCFMRNEVIVMISALYGRMKAGRCLEGEELEKMGAYVSNSRIIGCSVNVLELMDQKCSGQQMCEIRGMINDADLKQERPCNKGLITYLEADYKCATVIEADRSCLVNLPATSNPLHVMQSLSCGTKSQPWRLEAPTGQQINVRLLDFNSKIRETLTANNDLNNCQHYGYIVDKSAKKNISICRLTTERNRLIYTSKTNSLDIVVNPATSNETHENKLAFLLQIIAVGCSDVIPPVDAWLRRTENEAVIGCYTSRQEWHLRCVGSHWVGVMGNCTIDENQAGESPTASITKPVIVNPNQLLVILALAFLAIIICVTIICCGAVLLKRYYATAAQKQWHKVNEIESQKCFNGTASPIPITMNGHHVDI